MIISTKIGQTSFVNENGTRVSATVLDYNSCSVVGNRTIDRDGYVANIIAVSYTHLTLPTTPYV